ncbi:MAG: efflux RND transporter periplasmic adaptor subunit [Deltaproteobacteria bacterium]|nr:efflux RND transporter periplasmic adaptor subunit [Deltaproteobacteria bacterium]
MKPFFHKFAFVIFLLTACSKGPGGFFASNDKLPVSVDKVLIEDKQATVSLPAILEPSEKVEFQFPMDVKVEQVFVNLGDTVNAGDPLFRLNDQDFNLKLSQLKAQKMEQEALFEKNNYFLKNRDRLLEEKKIDKSMYDSLDSEVRAIEARVETLKADVALAENHLKQVTVNAPFTGMVALKNIANGASVPARQVLMNMVKADPMLVTFSMPENQAQSISKGMNVGVKIENFGDKIFPSSVLYVAPELKSSDHSFEVKAQLSNPQQTLKGGMAAQVFFVSPQKSKVLSIPSKAVLSEGNKDYVYIVRQNKAWRVRVYTRKNMENPEQAEILDGLTDEDVVVTEGQDKLKEGAEVNLWR